ncbi:MAG: D-3-phosphoglycerate dehydrogenase [Patescibacteria group bacterium]|jgi:D-3-phosphoglycerate dehydrogenase
MKKVLLTDDVHPLLIKGLEDAGYYCDFQPKIKLVEVRRIAGEYTGMIINSKILMDKAMLDQADQLKFVGRLGSGMEIIDLEYAAQKKVAIYNAPDGNCNAVGEQALGMLLALSNNLLRADAEVRRKEWRREANRGFELQGKTVGIIGFGYTGSSFAKKLAGMEVEVLAYDKYREDYTEDYPYVEEVDLETVLAKSDIISFHLPLTPETHHFANADFIKKCRKGVILINTSRGQVIKTSLLVSELQSGKVGGACLDVFENEKPQTFSTEEEDCFQQLYQLPQVVLTPHIAGWTVESKERLASILLRKILTGK